MTGEITLRGRVLPIGGLREKSMAALRNGIHTVIIPAENEKDLQEIDPSVRSALHFIPVEHIDQVLSCALEQTPLTPTDKNTNGMPESTKSRGNRVSLQQ
jgi:ATP-dependent Lon protease